MPVVVVSLLRDRYDNARHCKQIAAKFQKLFHTSPSATQSGPYINSNAHANVLDNYSQWQMCIDCMRIKRRITPWHYGTQNGSERAKS
jgi:hypothetical protein